MVTAEKDDQLSLVREQAQKEIEEVKAENDRMQQREADLRVCGMEKAVKCFMCTLNIRPSDEETESRVFPTDLLEPLT